MKRIVRLTLCLMSAAAIAPAASYFPPPSPRVKLNFDLNWKFVREDAPGAEAPGFDDSAWTTVSTPHTFNDVDSFRQIISHGGGDRGTYKGLAWYRKHFKLPAKLAGNRIFLEFEGMRQAGDIFLNGKQVGLYENGVTAYGVDISAAVHFGNEENVLAVKVDNRTNYQERATSTTFEWNANDFNPDHGGINRHVWLHATGKIYQTPPLYYGLESAGVYVHAGNFNIPGKSAEVTVDSEVRNASGDRATVELSAVIVDRTGQVRARLPGNSVDMVDGEKTILNATGDLKTARFWSTEDPYLYDVYSILTVDGKVVDVKAVGRNNGKPVAQEELTTAGPPAQIKLTPILGPQGLRADGADVAMIDVEILDAKGHRCPTDDDRVEFTVTGPAIWRGGYNSGKIDSTNNLYLNTELGINRVFVRSSLSAGSITVSATRSGLNSAQVKFVSRPVQVNDGLSSYLPQHLAGPAGR